MTATATRKAGFLAEELGGHALEVHAPRDRDVVRPAAGTNGVIPAGMLEYALGGTARALAEYGHFSGGSGSRD